MNGSSRSAQAVAAEASAVAASVGCFVFAAGSSNGSSSWRATPSRVGPLCWLGVLGFATDVSPLKESSIWEYVCVWWGSLERQSGTRFALPARHRKSISYSCRLRAYLCSLGSRLRLRNSHVGAEQSVTKVKRLPATYCLKCLIALRTAMHTRSVGPRRESVFEKRWLEKARTRSSRPTGYRSTAPAPAELASVCTMKVLFQSGNASTVGDVSVCFNCRKASASLSPHAIGNLRAFLGANYLFLSKSVSGAAVML